MRVDSNVLAQLCKTYGPQLNVPPSLNGAQLLWALSGNESSFGSNCNPRHEPGYCPIMHGHYAPAIATLTRDFGCLAHCSYGPWQIMACNASGFTPLDLLDPDKAAHATVNFLNREILGRQKATTLEQIADAYNSGNWSDANVPTAYIEKFVASYRQNILS